jgi:hypothetical protein
MQVKPTPIVSIKTTTDTSSLIFFICRALLKPSNSMARLLPTFLAVNRKSRVFGTSGKRLEIGFRSKQGRDGITELLADGEVAVLENFADQ